MFGIAHYLSRNVNCLSSFFSSSYHRVVISSLPAGTDREKLESLLSMFANFQVTHQPDETLYISDLMLEN